MGLRDAYINLGARHHRGTAPMAAPYQFAVALHDDDLSVFVGGVRIGYPTGETGKGLCGRWSGRSRTRHRDSANLRVSYAGPSRGAPVETDPTGMCEPLVGLLDVNVNGVGDWALWSAHLDLDPSATTVVPLLAANPTGRSWQLHAEIRNARLAGLWSYSLPASAA